MEWFEDEEFWNAFYPYMFPADRIAEAEEQVDKLLALVNFQGRDVLDLCCGPGRHSVSLARRGFAVAGVDRTGFLLDKARARAEEAGVNVEWVHEDMRRFVRQGAFDLVINMFTSFGYFDEKDEDLHVLRNIHQCLRPGGSVVIDTLGKERLARIFQPITAQDEPDGALMIQRHEIFDDWTRIRNEWMLVQNGTAHTFRFHHTIYSAQEMKDRLTGCGFDNIRIYGDLEGAEYGVNAKRLIVAAKKSVENP